MGQALDPNRMEEVLLKAGLRGAPYHSETDQRSAGDRLR